MSRKNSETRAKDSPWGDGLSARVREIRISAFGQRGRARFAEALGISPSTYNYYERGRIPPMPILLKISEVAGVDLRWLLTGEFPEGRSGGEPAPEHGRILARMSALLPERKEAAAALSALLDLLEAAPDMETRAATPAGSSPAADEPTPPALRIPVLGRTAAGVPHFWKPPQQAVDLLQSAIFRGAEAGQTLTGTLADAEATAADDSDTHVCLVQLTRSVRVGELNIAEFLDCLNLGEQWPDAFALRIDGDSMHPSLSHGDLVILSPSETAQQGRPAVVQLRNQIGVTCKLFYQDKGYIRLIPVNEHVAPTKHPVKELVWALKVLYRVRFSV